ncbi:glycine betaine ABC transporter substrate-binding protein [Desulfoplanes sp.]
MFKRLLILAILLAGSTLGTLPCGAQQSAIKLVTPPYACALTTTNVAKAMLDKMGYKTEIIELGVATMWKSLETGDSDVSVSMWLPTTHGQYYEEVKDGVENYGPNTLGARLGWVVPAYVPLESITELNANKEKFDNKIIGIGPSSGLMLASEKAVDAYDIDMELVQSSGAAMTAVLGNKIRQNAWVVVTGWSPHWKFGRWDLKYLEDPKGVLGDEEEIVTIARNGFAKDYPRAAAALDRLSWDIDTMQTVMAWNQEEGADPYENANRFFKEHPEILKEWIGN